MLSFGEGTIATIKQKSHRRNWKKEWEKVQEEGPHPPPPLGGGILHGGKIWRKIGSEGNEGKS